VQRFFGGTMSRAEGYGLFFAAVVLIGGGISGAIVVTSGSEVAAPEPTVVATTVPPTTETTTTIGPPVTEAPTTTAFTPAPTAAVTDRVVGPDFSDRSIYCPMPDFRGEHITASPGVAGYLVPSVSIRQVMMQTCGWPYAEPGMDNVTSCVDPALANPITEGSTPTTHPYDLVRWRIASQSPPPETPVHRFNDKMTFAVQIPPSDLTSTYPIC
jgi:hypothetical protein